MAEPRFKKTLFLRLGYTKTPRKLRQTEPPKRKMKKTKKKSSDCPGGVQRCRDCTIISSDTLLGKELQEKPAAEKIAPLFEGIIPQRHCCSEGGEGCYGEE